MKQNNETIVQKIKSTFVDSSIKLIFSIVIATLTFIAGLVGGTYSRAYTLVTEVDGFKDTAAEVETLREWKVETEKVLTVMGENYKSVTDDIEEIKDSQLRQEKDIKDILKSDN